MNSLQKDQLTPANIFLNSPSSSEVKTTLKGIEVDLFSYQLEESSFEKKLKEVCGNQFTTEIKKSTDLHTTFYISPEDYCLVDGGMMYKSAGAILTELTSKGFLIKGFRTVED